MKNEQLLELLIKETVELTLKELLPSLEPAPYDYSQYFTPKRKTALSHYRFRKLSPVLQSVPKTVPTRRGKYHTKFNEPILLSPDEQQLESQKENIKLILQQNIQNPIVQRLLSGKRTSKENIYNLANYLIDYNWVNLPKTQYKKLAQILAMINFQAGHSR